MAKSEFLKRIDAEVARTNAFLEEDRAARQREMAEHGEALQDISLEMRQMSLRGERLAQGYLRAIEDLSRASQAVLADMSEEIRANTQAVLRMLDRFDAGGGPATAGT